MIRANRKIELLVVSITLAILLGWFFKDVLFSNRIIVERDLSRYYYPLRKFAVTCIKSGTFPLWNPYLFCGNPLFGALQSSVLYPVSIIYYLGNFEKMFNLFAVVHFLLAGMFMYFLMREFGASCLAGFFSSAAFALSGYMVSVINLITSLSAVSWFPLAVLFFYRILKIEGHCRRKYLNSIFLGIVWVFMFLGGEPSHLYLTIVLFFIGAVYFTFEGLVEKKRLDLSYLLAVAVASVTFLGLSAFQLLPFIEFLKISSRERMGICQSCVWSMPPRDIISMVLPFYHDIFRLFEDYWARQSWLDNYYVGIVVFIFFILAVLFENSKKAKAIFALGLAGLLLCFGGATSIYPVLYNFIPAFKYVRYTIRYFFIPTFAISALAGIGLDYYIKTKDSVFKKKAFFILVFSVLVCILFLFLNTHFQQISLFLRERVASFITNRPLPPKYIFEGTNDPLFAKFINIDLINLRRGCLFFVLTGILIFLGTEKRVRAKYFVFPWLIFLAIVDLFMVNEGFILQEKIDKFIKPTSNVEYLMKEYQKGYRDYHGDFNKSLFRICASPQTSNEQTYVPERDFWEGLEASKDRLATNRMMEFGIYDITMYDSVYNRRNSRFMRLIMNDESQNLGRILDLLNVRFIAGLRGPQTLEDFTLVNQTNAANLYENRNYLPRAFLVEDFVVIKDEERTLEVLAGKEFNPAKEVILEEEPERIRDDKRRIREDKEDAARISSYKPNQVVIEADVAGRPKFLVLTDTFYPGWKAYVDGERAKIYRADSIFRAVLLPIGSQRVKFIYAPASFKIGLLISFIALYVILYIIFRLTYNMQNNIINRHLP